MDIYKKVIELIEREISIHQLGLEMASKDGMFETSHRGVVSSLQAVLMELKNLNRLACSVSRIHDYERRKYIKLLDESDGND